MAAAHRSAQARHRVIGFQEVDVDLGRGVRHAQQFVVVKIALHDTSSFDIQLRVHQRRQAVDYRTLHLLLGAGKVDDLGADAGGKLLLPNCCGSFGVYIPSG
jgi:hypothetical protein